MNKCLKYWINVFTEVMGRTFISLGVLHYGINNIDNYGTLVIGIIFLIWVIKPFFDFKKIMVEK